MRRFLYIGLSFSVVKYHLLIKVIKVVCTHRDKNPCNVSKTGFDDAVFAELGQVSNNVE